jgi:hypothetical protein
MYISIYRSLVMARFKILRAQNLDKIKKNKKIFHILSYNLHKTKVEVFLFLYKKIREERVDTIKKPYPTYLTLLGSGFSVSED